MAMLLGVILFSSDLSANLAKNLIKYLKKEKKKKSRYTLFVRWMQQKFRYQAHV
jgi:hypothetical protein